MPLEKGKINAPEREKKALKIYGWGEGGQSISKLGKKGGKPGSSKSRGDSVDQRSYNGKKKYEKEF